VSASSYDLTKYYSVLYNIGQIYVSLAKPVEAIAAFEGYLASGGKKVPANRRLEVEQEIAKQKTRIALLTIRTTPDGATIKVDGETIGTSPLAQPVPLKIGDHVVSASAEDYEEEEVKVTLAGEDRRVVELALKARVEKLGEERSPPRATEESPKPPLVEVGIAETGTRKHGLSGRQTTGLIAGIAGLAGIGTGGLLWLLAQRNHESALDKNDSDPERAGNLNTTAQTYALYGNISAIAGGVLVGLGAILYLTGAPEEEPEPMGLRTRVVPAVGWGYAGVSAGGTW